MNGDAYLRCSLCAEPLNPKSPSSLRLGTGWIPVNRSAGGANQIRMPRLHDEWAHAACVDKQKQGFIPGQEALVV